MHLHRACCRLRQIHAGQEGVGTRLSLVLLFFSSPLLLDIHHPASIFPLCEDPEYAAVRPLVMTSSSHHRRRRTKAPLPAFG